MSDPVIRTENSRLRLELPAPPDDHHFYPVSGAVLQGFVDQVNELRDERDQLRGQLPGYCPMGCGQHLFLSAGGYVTCAWIDCPRPDAVSTLLADRETEHVVLFGRAGFTIRHPLRERLDDALMTCDLHTWCTELDGPLDTSGPVRMRQNTDGEWEVI